MNLAVFISQISDLNIAEVLSLGSFGSLMKYVCVCVLLLYCEVKSGEMSKTKEEEIIFMKEIIKIK